MAENLVILTSTEWVCLMPSLDSKAKISHLMGDTIVIEGGVDLDSLIV